MRRSELLRLRWTSIDWSAKTVTIEPWTTKAKCMRVLPLNDEALAVLKAWRRQVKFEFVFTNEVCERLREVRDWDRIKTVAQIEDFRFMDTRHHTATRMINEGAPVYHVQKILGHTDSRMTQRYLKARDIKLQEALAVLDRPRSPAPMTEAANRILVVQGDTWGRTRAGFLSGPRKLVGTEGICRPLSDEWQSLIGTFISLTVIPFLLGGK
ncbi:tyrosine-type recombinase/integrase [Paraburkholderia tuberum]|uniref:tyrosine-type recombinase/integrase n=1 Tax=Paraburkholderia tuberum TaxID=157910 RepID=UPI001FC7E800|nr:site-specific integrase [Paraburkholderia tuberum]